MDILIYLTSKGPEKIYFVMENCCFLDEMSWKVLEFYSAYLLATLNYNLCLEEWAHKSDWSKTTGGHNEENSPNINHPYIMKQNMVHLENLERNTCSVGFNSKKL